MKKFFFYLVIFLIFYFVFYPYLTHYSKIIVVKEIININNYKNILIDNSGMKYEIVDSNYYFIFKSKQIIDKLKENMKIKIYGYGLRINMFNIYPKIIDIKPYR